MRLPPIDKLPYRIRLMFYVMDIVKILMNNLQAVNLYFITLVEGGKVTMWCRYRMQDIE